MNLHELKQPFENLYKVVKSDYDNISSEDIVGFLDKVVDEVERNRLYSVLVHRSWQALVNIYYKQQNTSLSAEECYDIYLEALDYVISTKPWEKTDSSLSGDKDAFIKAVMQCSSSRKINYVVAQHRQKRIINCNTLSVDALNEDFPEGYFVPYYDDKDNILDEDMNSIVRSLFNEKQYLTAFIMDAILTNNVFTDDNDLDKRKLRKHLRELNDLDCFYFSKIYDTNFEEVKYSLKYFQHLQTNKLSDKINQCLSNLRLNSAIKEVANVT